MTKEQKLALLAKIEVEIIILDQMIMEAWDEMWRYRYDAEVPAY